MKLHFNNLAVMLGFLSVAALMIFAAHPVFRSVPASYFAGAGAAGTIALISSIGVSSGMISPWVIGQIRTLTGGMDGAMYLRRTCWPCAARPS